MNGDEGIGARRGIVQVQYVFLDIVGFTKGRVVEAQTEIIERLNNIVRESAAEQNSESRDLVYLPTGDGMAIGIIGSREIDAHMNLAVSILSKLEDHNGITKDPQRRFVVRVGINENRDNLVVDINGKTNLAGSGINLAQRVMALADGGNILASQAVFEVLSSREKYYGRFREFAATDKHGNRFNVYQFVEHGLKGLDPSVPSGFVLPGKKDAALTKVVANYMVDAAAHVESLKVALRDPSYMPYSANILLYLRACDSISKEEAGDYRRPYCFTWGAEEESFERQLEFYHNIDMGVKRMCAHLLFDNVLKPFDDYFDQRASGTAGFIFLSELGKARLRIMFPDLLRGISDESDVATFRVAEEDCGPNGD